MDECIPGLLLLVGAVESMMSLVSCSSYQNTTALNFPSLQAAQVLLLTLVPACSQSHLHDHRFSDRSTKAVSLNGKHTLALSQCVDTVVQEQA